MTSKYLIAAALVIAPGIATAQTAPTAPAQGTAPAATATSSTAPAAAPAVGGKVFDAQGGEVGTIASIDAGNAVIDTGTNKAAVPLTSLGTGPKGPTLGLTKVQLDAAATQQQAQVAAAFKSQLVAGAQVYGAGGTAVGTIKTVDAEFVTVTTTKGDAKLPVAGFGPGPKGVTIGMTAAQLDAALGGAAATTPAATASTTTPK